MSAAPSRPRWRRAVAAAGAPAAAGAAAALWLALAAWIAGRVLTDRTAWSQWLWWMPSWSALVVAALGAALAARPGRRRRRRLVAWLAVLGLAAVQFVTGEHRLVRPPPPAPAGGLSIAHWNLGQPGPRLQDKCADVILALDADITVLTNAGAVPWDERIRAHFEPAVPMRLGPFTIICCPPIEELRWVMAEKGISVALLRVQGLAIYLVDLPSDPNRPRRAIAERVHERLAQLGAPPPDLVVGDLNVPRGSASLATMFPEMHHAFAEGGHGLGATFPREHPVYHLDHVLLAPGLRCPRYDIVAATVGRHRPQKAWIEPAAP